MQCPRCGREHEGGITPPAPGHEDSEVQSAVCTPCIEEAEVVEVQKAMATPAEKPAKKSGKKGGGV